MSETVTHQDAYQAVAAVADVLLRDGLPLIRFDVADAGRQATFLFAMPGGGDWSERYVCKLPIEGLTAAKVVEQYRRFADV